MTVYNFVTASNSSLDLGAYSIHLGTVTITDTAVMSVVDDDGMFDDESPNYGESFDTSSQVLAADFGDADAGQVVQSVYVNQITNTTTGETGEAHLIRIHTGTDPNEEGSQFGEYVWSFTIDVSAGDVIKETGAHYVGQVKYDDLVVCFTRGTHIQTPDGQIAVEKLAIGDLVQTLDHGAQPIRWIGARCVQAQENLAPILIKKGALGNCRDLRVSPQHRMLVRGWAAALFAGEDEVLIPAISLINDHSILRDPGGEVTYIHMLFDRHEIVFAEDAPSESFFPGATGINALEHSAQTELFRIFPELAVGDYAGFGPAARLGLKGNTAKMTGALSVKSDFSAPMRQTGHVS